MYQPTIREAKLELIRAQAYTVFGGYASGMPCDHVFCQNCPYRVCGGIFEDDSYADHCERVLDLVRRGEEVPG